MELIDNITRLLGDDLKATLKPKARLKIAASCFSMYAFEALKAELEKIDELRFIFTSPTFTASEVTDKIRKERKEFHIPKLDRERSLYGSEFEIQLRNKLTQRAIAKECADWMRRKARFKSNRTKAPMQPFAVVQAPMQTNGTDTAYMPLHGFTAVDLGYQQGNAVSNLVNKMDEPAFAATYLSLFDQIWNDPEKLEDVTAQICEHIASVYQENSPESIYFLMLYNIFNEFLDEIDEDVLPNDRTGYQDTLIWKKLFNFQKDAATGIINKLETYSGCILADSVGLGKTFTALAVVKYYELRNKSVLVLCPKKLADNWLNYNRNLKTNIFAKDRFNYDVLCHTDLSRTSGESFGTPLNRINWGNYDLVVIDESHNFRNNDAYKDKETRYQKLMNKVIKKGVKTKVLMLSATPVNNRFADLRNQLALAYEGDSEILSKKLKTGKSVEEIFRGAQTAFNTWAKLPPGRAHRARHPRLAGLRLLRAAGQRDHRTLAQAHPDLLRHQRHRAFPRAPQAAVVSLRADHPGRCDGLQRYLRPADAAQAGGVRPGQLHPAQPPAQVRRAIRHPGKQWRRQTAADRPRAQSAGADGHQPAQAAGKLGAGLPPDAGFTGRQLRHSLQRNRRLQRAGTAAVGDMTQQLEDLEADEDDFDFPEGAEIGGKVKISLATWTCHRGSETCKADLRVIDSLLQAMHRVTPEHDAKLQHLKAICWPSWPNPSTPATASC
jgi:hypothetical protein